VQHFSLTSASLFYWRHRMQLLPISGQEQCTEHRSGGCRPLQLCCLGKGSLSEPTVSFENRVAILPLQLPQDSVVSVHISAIVFGAQNFCILWFCIPAKGTPMVLKVVCRVGFLPTFSRICTVLQREGKEDRDDLVDHSRKSLCS
jgi:hypothetical protein